MLTPAFEVRQDKDFLTVVINAPFAKVAETEIFIEGDDFKFFSKPYFLRLALPGNIVEDGREKADYNADNGEFTVTVPKETPGEHFEGLDMLTKLLEARSKTAAPPSLIEVLDDRAVPDTNQDVEDDFDWCVEQVPYVEQPSLMGVPKYGFANQKSGVFARLQEDMVYIVDCSDPDSSTAGERREQRVQAEWDKFDVDHYVADLYEDDLLKPLLDFRPRCYDDTDLINAGTPLEMAVELTGEEKEVMRKLPRKEYLLDAAEETAVYLGLVDILYAYAYNHRTTEGENHCESGWTICKISATLSWLEVFTSVHEVVRSSFRRSLCYPLYRHWKLNEMVLQDIIHILQLGRRSVLKILLEIRHILMDQDCRYILNDLYITDYCVWIQSASEKILQSLTEAVVKLKITKDDVGLNLPEMEKLAQHAIQSEESEDIENLTEKLDAVHVNQSSGDQESDSENCESDVGSDSVTTDSDEVTSENGDVGTKTDVTSENDDVVTDICDVAENKNGAIIGSTDERMEYNSLTVKDCVTTENDLVIENGIVSNPDVFESKGGVIGSTVKIVECDGLRQDVGAGESGNVAADCDGVVAQTDDAVKQENGVVVKSASQPVTEPECLGHGFDDVDSDTRTIKQLERCIVGIDVTENSGKNERNSGKQSKPVMIEEIESSS